MSWRTMCKVGWLVSVQLLLDLEEEKRARWEHISCTAVAGRGAFGTVLTGTWRRPGAAPLAVAVKALQPVAPPDPADLAALQAYKVGWTLTDLLVLGI